jgi:hypothetical protein
LPPLEFCLGTSPKKAANSRGPEKLAGSPNVATRADAVIGPMPEVTVTVAITPLLFYDVC